MKWPKTSLHYKPCNLKCSHFLSYFYCNYRYIINLITMNNLSVDTKFIVNMKNYCRKNHIQNIYIYTYMCICISLLIYLDIILR